jgi:cyclopropane fatty-acyl-phospholipid synthase-like methyltransferase
LDFYDAELRAHHEHLRAAYGISSGDAVVDIGCGTGLTTREARAPQCPAAFSASTYLSACLSAPVS